MIRLRNGSARAFLALRMLALAVAAPSAVEAQVVRAFTPRYSTNGNGDITLIANTLMSCTGGGSNANSCARARNGSGNNLNNNDWTMVYVDVDGDASTFNSSTREPGAAGRGDGAVGGPLLGRLLDQRARATRCASARRRPATRPSPRRSSTRSGSAYQRLRRRHHPGAGGRQRHLPGGATCSRRTGHEHATPAGRWSSSTG